MTNDYERDSRSERNDVRTGIWVITKVLFNGHNSHKHTLSQTLTTNTRHTHREVVKAFIIATGIAERWGESGRMLWNDFHSLGGSTENEFSLLFFFLWRAKSGHQGAVQCWRLEMEMTECPPLVIATDGHWPPVSWVPQASKRWYLRGGDPDIQTRWVQHPSTAPDGCNTALSVILEELMDGKEIAVRQCRSIAEWWSC